MQMYVMTTPAEQTTEVKPIGQAAIACGNGVLHSYTAEWARRSRDVLLAARVRKVRAPEGGMPANGRAE